MDAKQPLPVRLGIVGTGAAVRNIHLPTLLKLQAEFSIAAVCSRSLAHAREVAAFAGTPSATDAIDLLLEDPDIEALLIALPIGASHQVVQHAIESGKHVITEKPLGATVHEAAELTELSRSRPEIVAMVASNVRYGAIARSLAETVWDGSIGQPHIVYFHSIAHIDPHTQPHWRARPDYRGGCLLDGGIHVATLLRSVFGEAIAVAALDKIEDARLGGQVGMSMHVKTDRDVQIICSFLRTPYPAAASSTTLNVYGTAGSLTFSSTDALIHIHRWGDPPRMVTPPRDAGYTTQMHDFFNAIRHGTRPLASFEQGLQDLRWLSTALDSASLNTSLPLESGLHPTHVPTQ